MSLRPRALRFAAALAVGLALNTVCASAASLAVEVRPHRPCAMGLSGKINGSTTSIMAELVARWRAAFASAQPGIQVEVPPPYGPPQGSLSPRLQEFLQGKSDFAFLSRDLTDVDTATYLTAHGRLPAIVDVAGGSWRRYGYVDPVVFIVHRSNPLRALNFRQLDALFSETRLRGAARPTHWGDFGVAAAWAIKPIHVLGAASWGGDDSARARVVRERVLSTQGLNGRWRRDLQSGSGIEADVPDRVAADPLAIGFTGLGHLPTGARVLMIVPDGGGQPIAPTYENVARMRYPLARTLKIALVSPVRPELREFVDFLVSREGQRVVREQNIFLPLPPTQPQTRGHCRD